MSKAYPARETWRPRKKRKRPPSQLGPDVVLHSGGVYLEAGHTYGMTWTFKVSADEYVFGPPQTGKYETTGGPYPRGPHYQGHDRLDVATPEEEQ